jgi:predicted metal-binding membrane protein
MHTVRDLAPVRNALLLVAAGAWTVLLLESHAHAMPLMNWGLMLAAMMAPALVAPVGHVYLRSFARRRVWLAVLFVIGYAAIWMAVGALLLAVARFITSIATESRLLAPGALALAAAWQCSPSKQRCLNRCHARPEVAAFGAAAAADAFRFGLRDGMWCAGSCWALMLLPSLVAPSLHLATMAAVSVQVFSERCDLASPPSWRWRGQDKITRFLAAQSSIVILPWLERHRSRTIRVPVMFG